MPKAPHHISLDIDLLKPKGEKQQLAVQTIHWALSAGRYLIVFVEIIVLLAFLARFKLDSQIADNKDSINQQLPFIEALKNDETLIRQTQFQLSNVAKYKSSEPSYVDFLNKIASQTPNGVLVSSLELTNNSGSLALKITGTAQNNDQISTFLYGLKQDTFKDATLTSISLEQGLINFSINGNGPVGL